VARAMRKRAAIVKNGEFWCEYSQKKQALIRIGAGERYEEI
jgi:hypothetical protein